MNYVAPWLTEWEHDFCGYETSACAQREPHRETTCAYVHSGAPDELCVIHVLTRTCSGPSAKSDGRAAINVTNVLACMPAYCNDWSTHDSERYKSTSICGFDDDEGGDYVNSCVTGERRYGVCALPERECFCREKYRL